MKAFPNTPPLFFSVFFFFSFHLAFFCNATCNPIDKASLLHFKSKITHDASNLLRMWKHSVDCCIKWDGVACDLAGRVVNVSPRPLLRRRFHLALDCNGGMRSVVDLNTYSSAKFPSSSDPLDVTVKLVSILESYPSTTEFQQDQWYALPFEDVQS